ncbi:hypothetical protein TNCV_1670621 [Trichonephila clavipes]|nr:hypothetical protein TNCV_1670621 [Trichonephila clavipes]
MAWCGIWSCGVGSCRLFLRHGQLSNRCTVLDSLEKSSNESAYKSTLSSVMASGCMLGIQITDDVTLVPENLMQVLFSDGFPWRTICRYYCNRLVIWSGQFNGGVFKVIIIIDEYLMVRDTPLFYHDGLSSPSGRCDLSCKYYSRGRSCGRVEGVFLVGNYVWVPVRYKAPELLNSRSDDVSFPGDNRKVGSVSSVGIKS